MSNALHHRTDAVSSVVALVAVVGAMCGAPLLDPLAGLAVMLGGVEGVRGFDSIRSRRMGPQTLVDLTIQIAQRARFAILKKLPMVSDVIVTTAVDEKPCPVSNVLRPHGEIEGDVRRVVRQELREVTDVPKVTVHYTGLSTSADVFVRVDPRLRVHEAIAIASQVRRVLVNRIKDLCSVDVHLDLVETYMAVEARAGTGGSSDSFYGSSKLRANLLSNLLDRASSGRKGGAGGAGDWEQSSWADDKHT
ncbi:hypothetical protein JKP88DRAFT_352028 [Tribonema minus]|uniref:Cation efflux protein cytoplasmic domain-containing protein n=1 Tax=Tribonema minus TaxID=303371 RepID=A0A836CQT4_9STRA|nr:hypothetical protein JKP88DRAFT_352028 [Tribonema minus]